MNTHCLKSNNKCKVAGRAGKQQMPCGMEQKSNSNKPFPLRNDKHCISGQCKPWAGSSFKNITINLLLSPQPVAVLITLFWQENPFPNKVWVAGKGRANHREINSACKWSKESCSSGWLLSHHPAASTRHINTHATLLPPHHISITAECSAVLFQDHFSLCVIFVHLNTDCP